MYFILYRNVIITQPRVAVNNAVSKCRRDRTESSRHRAISCTRPRTVIYSYYHYNIGFDIRIIARSVVSLPQPTGRQIRRRIQYAPRIIHCRILWCKQLQLQARQRRRTTLSRHISNNPPPPPPPLDTSFPVLQRLSKCIIITCNIIRTADTIIGPLRSSVH